MPTNFLSDHEKQSSRAKAMMATPSVITMMKLEARLIYLVSTPLILSRPIVNRERRDFVVDLRRREM